MQQPKFTESLFHALDSFMLFILTMCAFFSIVSGYFYDSFRGWIEGVCILITIIVIVLITSLNNWIKDRQFVKH